MILKNWFSFGSTANMNWLTQRVYLPSQTQGCIYWARVCVCVCECSGSQRWLIGHVGCIVLISLHSVIANSGRCCITNMGCGCKWWPTLLIQIIRFHFAPFHILCRRQSGVKCPHLAFGPGDHCNRILC